MKERAMSGECDDCGEHALECECSKSARITNPQPLIIRIDYDWIANEIIRRNGHICGDVYKCLMQLKQEQD